MRRRQSNQKPGSGDDASREGSERDRGERDGTADEREQRGPDGQMPWGARERRTVLADRAAGFGFVGGVDRRRRPDMLPSHPADSVVTGRSELLDSCLAS